MRTLRLFAVRCLLRGFSRFSLIVLWVFRLIALFRVWRSGDPAAAAQLRKFTHARERIHASRRKLLKNGGHRFPRPARR